MKTKNHRTPRCQALALALLLGGASLSFAQTADLYLGTFDTGDQGVQPNGCGIAWGTGTGGWDGAQDNTGGGGSLYVSVIFDPANDTPSTQYICIPGENPWWNQPTAINFSQYKSLQFDIKWDNTSPITIDQFNNPGTFPSALLQSGQTLAGSIQGLEIDVVGVNQAGLGAVIGSTNIPTDASNGWVHIKIPLSSSQSGIDGASGIAFHKWINNNAALAGQVSGNFWIDNVMLEGTAGPPPPPTVQPLAKAKPGLNVFASSMGNSFYDRQEAQLQQNTGLGWVGHATEENPVTYSFTISGFPDDPASYGAEAYLFLVPNPAANYSAPDWNEPNCALAMVQLGANGATMQFQYKVNEPNQNQMYSAGSGYTNAPGSWDGVTPDYLESGNLGSVTSPTALGTWTIKFTSDTNVTLIAPGGNTTSFVIPPYNIAPFTENTGFNVLLGMQANNAAAINQAVVYTDFAVTGVPAPYSETFLGETTLDTTVTWRTSVSGGPAGVLIVPEEAAYWLRWTLPDTGFGLEVTPSLAGSTWTPLTGAVAPLSGLRQRLVTTNELPAGNSAFFRLAKHGFAKLQVLLPGETAAPGTATGKTGTPDPVSLGAGGLINVTVNAVDDNWYPVAGVSDGVTITSSDTSAVLPNPASLVNGTATFLMQFGSTGSWTITATDTTDGAKTPDTSTAVTVTD